MELYAHLKSYYSNRHGGLVTLEDDVQSIVRQVKEMYGEGVTVEMDDTTGWFHFVGHENGTDYLIFSTEELDGRALQRLIRSDKTLRGFQDPYAAVEREQDEAQMLIEARSRERIYEAGERLAHAMKHSGLDDRLPMTVGYKKEIVLPPGVRSVNADRNG